MKTEDVLSTLKVMSADKQLYVTVKDKYGTQIIPPFRCKVGPPANSPEDNAISITIIGHSDKYMNFPVEEQNSSEDGKYLTFVGPKGTAKFYTGP